MIIFASHYRPEIQNIETINQIGERVKESLNCSTNDLVKIAEIEEETTLPSTEELENKLEKLHQERERLGGVNLLAEQEATEMETQELDNIE